MTERHFHQELGGLKNNLLKMAGLVERAIANSIAALIDRDSSRAKEVIAGDDAINDLENTIDEQCVTLLALQQPMAVDLRLITVALKIVKDLERMGDQAVNIAERVLPLNEEPQLKPYIDLPHMARIVQQMVKDSLDSFVTGNAELAREICTRDDLVDALNNQIFRELLTYMMSDPTTITRAVHLIIIGRCLERIGDHATNVAESVVYMVQARNIKHQAEKKIIDQR